MGLKPRAFYSCLLSLLDQFLVSAHASSFVAGLSLSHGQRHQPTHAARFVLVAQVSKPSCGWCFLTHLQAFGLAPECLTRPSMPAFTAGLTQIGLWPKAMIWAAPSSYPSPSNQIGPYPTHDTHAHRVWAMVFRIKC
ncbi:hypothetical protein ACFX13_015052 [Malus domestica]